MLGLALNYVVNCPQRCKCIFEGNILNHM